MNNGQSNDTYRVKLLDIFQEMRPRQWTKNAVVLAAFFFALGDKQQSVSPLMLWTALLSAFLFSITASGVYVFNDILDIDCDRRHPIKYQRPLAAGVLPFYAAWCIVVVCLSFGLLGSWLLSRNFGMVVTGYVALQAAYTLKLKHIFIIDVFVIAIGFVLRAIAGALVVNVAISSWLLICTFLMAMFMALCKRRHERRMIDEEQVDKSRPSLLAADTRLFDQLIAIVAGAVIVVYAIYTQWPDTVAKFETSYLSLTIPFVVFGLFRYLDLVYRQAKGDQPEYILLTDIPLIVDIILFAACALVIILI